MPILHLIEMLFEIGLDLSNYPLHTLFGAYLSKQFEDLLVLNLSNYEYATTITGSSKG